ncbi:DUF1259 domain-containing protein [bacterium]|nr:DUF1259 domain-containing protein [bacterium]MCI0604003.1 DUF1259 domain-containing protein [bacterium]
MKHFVVFFCFLFFCTILFAQDKALDPFQELDRVFEMPGKTQEGGVYKFSWPRSDLRVTVNDVSIETGLALGSWAAFKKSAGNELMTMGDLVLLASEVNPVIQQLQTGGFEVLGIHNHIIGESPQVMYVHFSSHGPAERLAQTIKNGLGRTKTPLKSVKSPVAADLEPIAGNSFEKVQEILGRKGNQNGNVLQIGVPRSGKIQMNGEEVPPSMGMAIALNFQSTGGKVAATGDFVLTGDEVNPVMKELQANGIQVTALHNHMIDDEPRLFFLHFWVIESPDVVANALKSALTRINAR